MVLERKRKGGSPVRIEGQVVVDGRWGGVAGQTEGGDKIRDAGGAFLWRRTEAGDPIAEGDEVGGKRSRVTEPLDEGRVTVGAAETSAKRAKIAEELVRRINLISVRTSDQEFRYSSRH